MRHSSLSGFEGVHETPFLIFHVFSLETITVRSYLVSSMVFNYLLLQSKKFATSYFVAFTEPCPR